MACLQRRSLLCPHTMAYLRFVTVLFIHSLHVIYIYIISKNIIYIIECKACGDKYVGETGRCFKDRMFNHISDIRRNKNGPVSRHFYNADNICFGAEYDMNLYPIEQIPDQGNAQRNKSLRTKRELHWIKTLGTQFPHGMNHKIVRKRDVFITFPFSNIYGTRGDEFKKSSHSVLLIDSIGHTHYLKSQHRLVITPIIKYLRKLLIHSRISTM